MNKGRLLKPLNMPTTIVGTFYHGQGFLEKLQSTYLFHLPVSLILSKDIEKNNIIE